LSGMKDSMLGENGNDFGEYQDQIDTAFDELSDLEVTDDLVLRFYIDQDGYTRKIVVEDLELTVEDSTLDMGIDIEVWKDNAETDNVAVVITGESDGTTAEVRMDWATSYSKGVYEGEFNFEADDDSGSDTYSLSVNTSWDREDTSGENLGINLTYGDGSDTQDIKITGTLTDTAKETSLSDATLEMTDEYGETIILEFAYGIKIIPSTEIAIDTSDSTPLLEYEPLMKYLKGDYYS